MIAALAQEPSPLPRRLSAPGTAEEAYAVFLSIGDAYFTGGAEPRVDGLTYIEAWPALMAFLRRHKEALSNRGVVEAELEAGARLCHELSHCLAELPEVDPPPQGHELPVVSEAIAKLERMRDAVRRMGRGCEGARLLAEFAVGLSLDPARPAQVGEAISLFLEGASRNLERLHLFRFVTADLEELKEHRRAILSLEGAAPAAGRPDGEPSLLRADRLLAALEGFYASMATAISQAFSERDPRRIDGLRRIPRARERRAERSAA